MWFYSFNGFSVDNIAVMLNIIFNCIKIMEVIKIKKGTKNIKSTTKFLYSLFANWHSSIFLLWPCSLHTKFLISGNFINFDFNILKYKLFSFNDCWYY